MQETRDESAGAGVSLPNGDLTDTERIDKEQEELQTDDAYALFFVNNNWYLFLRLHQILCERLTKIYERALVIASEEARDRRDRKDSTAVALRLKPRMLYFEGEIDVDDYYPTFLDMVKSLLDGNMESNSYEDTLREMFGIHAYIAFTLDKVVQNAVRQLQHLVCDDPCLHCTGMFLDEKKSWASRGYVTSLSVEQAYQKRAEQELSDENCFKVYIYKGECRMTVELLDTEIDTSEEPVEVQKWSEYVDQYVVGSIIPHGLKEELVKKPVFLPRNIRMWRRRAKRQNELAERDSKKDDDKSKDDDASNSDTPSDKKIDNEDLDVMEGSECRFNLNNFKMVFVVNSESFLYKKDALQRARDSHPRVSQHFNVKFKNWHQAWLAKHTEDTQRKDCVDWLNGRCEGLVPNSTQCFTDNDLQRPPYCSYNRYRVEWRDGAS